MRILSIILSTGFGAGFSPIAPGTVGTLVGVLLALFLPLTWWSLLIFTLLGIYVSQQGEIIFEEKDSPKIVIDEIVGFFLAIYGLDYSLWLPAFILFRFLDIKKPWIIRKLQNYHGGIGVMADDLLAGILTNLVLRGISLLF
jgi:phosphatidylglycerophosphatase A